MYAIRSYYVATSGQGVHDQVVERRVVALEIHGDAGHRTIAAHVGVARAGELGYTPGDEGGGDQRDGGGHDEQRRECAEGMAPSRGFGFVAEIVVIVRPGESYNFV